MWERSWQTEMRWTWPFTAQMCSSEASRLNSMGLENSQICLKKVLEMNLKRNHFFNMNMLSCGVLLWESWKQGAGEHCPNFPKGLFQLPSCWAHNTTHGEKLGCSLVSYHTANVHLCLLYSSVLRTAFLLLLLISATWLLGLMAVNSDVMTFHYLFAIFSCLQVSWMPSCLWQTLVSTLLHPDFQKPAQHELT